MSVPLLQNVIGAGREIIDKLSEIAPIIIIGLIWLFGAIAKAMAASKKGQQPRPGRKPGAKPHQPDFDDLVRIVRERYRAAREQAQRGAQEPAVMHRPAPKPHRVPTPPARGKAETAPKLPFVEVTLPPVQPKVEEPLAMQTKIEKPPMEKLTPPLVEEYLAGPVSPVGVAEPHPYLMELANQYADPNGLRKAILHYEILGMPLALRE